MSEKNEGGGIAGLSSDQLQSAVQSIMHDPAFGRLLSEVQGKNSDETPAVPAITPEMMAKLPKMMAALSPLVSGMKEEKSEQKESDQSDRSDKGGKSDKGEKGDKGDKGGKGGLSDAEKRKKLLAALRPYLSEGRRDAVDGILKVTEMTDLLGGLGLPGSKS